MKPLKGHISTTSLSLHHISLSPPGLSSQKPLTLQRQYKMSVYLSFPVCSGSLSHDIMSGRVGFLGGWSSREGRVLVKVGFLVWGFLGRWGVLAMVGF